MKYPHLYKTFPLLLAFISGMSCSSYEELVIDNKIVLPARSSGYKFADSVTDKKPAAKSGKHKFVSISALKYLINDKGFNAESGIMNMGIKEALQGNLMEAEILFKQVEGIYTDGSVENNLAVIYEAAKRKKDAMKMYITALMKSPDNAIFKSNLLSFINNNNFLQQNNQNYNMVE